MRVAGKRHWCWHQSKAGDVSRMIMIFYFIYFIFFRCAICMIEFEVGDQMRFLPCLHAYHKDCIDDWLMRSFTCPSCMEPVDAALLSSFEG